MRLVSIFVLVLLALGSAGNGRAQERGAFRAPVARPSAKAVQHSVEVRRALTDASSTFRESARAEASNAYGSSIGRARDAASFGRLHAMRRALGRAELHASHVGREVFERDARSVTQTALRALVKRAAQHQANAAAEGAAPVTARTESRAARRALRTMQRLSRSAGVRAE